MTRPDGLFVRSLVAWYGLFQLVHIAVNMRGLLQLADGSLDFPALPPPGGWTTQSIPFLTAIAALDLANAILTLVFVYGYFRRAHWRFWLGTLTLTVSMYAALVFDYSTLAVGAWTRANLSGYLFVNGTFVPVILVFLLFYIWGARVQI